MKYPYKYYNKLGKLYLELSNLMKRAEQLEMNKDILLEDFIKEERQDILEKLGNIRYQMKEMGIDLKYRLKGEFWNDRTYN